MTTRKYSSRSQQTTLTSAVTSGALTIPVVNALTLLGGATISAGQTFTAVIDPDTALEEVIDITAVSSNNLTVTRAVDMSGAAAQDHSAGAVIRHMIIGRDLRESNLHIEASGAYNDGTGTHSMHGLGSSDGSVVGTDATQTLTNKTLISPVLTGTLQNDAGITFEGSTADAYETFLTVVDPTQDNTITLPNTTGTVVLATATQTLTNKTLTSPTISGSPVITGLSSAGMSASSAAPKDYVDSILGSATAASTSATSAAASATAAATSASSAATSASLAATSASSAATSATAAATSATSAAASATSAATSVTTAQAWAIQLVTPVSGTDYSAKYNANLAATSATSAAASATTAANSVATISGYATTASNSAAAAATSATSAAASATAAATSATSAAASATAAATSATSAAASATAAATSATSAAASASAAAATLANAVDKTTFDAKGDLLAGTANDAYAKLTVATTDGYVLTVSNAAATGLAWSAPAAGYSAPTLGSQTIASGTTYTNINGLTINSTTIPTSATLAKTADKLSVFAATTSAELKTVISDETGSGALVFGTSPSISGLTITGTLTAGASSGTNGQYLQSTATGTQWATVDALPSQSGNSGKYLTTNGTSASWAAIVTDPTPSIFMLMGA